MEKIMSSSNLNIIMKVQKDEVVFEIKDPKQLNKVLLKEIKKDFFFLQKDSIVIYPEQQIIESQRCIIEDTSHII